MRWLAAIGLGLHGTVNLLAALYTPASGATLPMPTITLLLLTGAALLATAGVVVVRSRRARAMTVAVLIATMALAAYHERILGLGHPVHHLARAAWSLVLVWVLWRVTRDGSRSGAVD